MGSESLFHRAFRRVRMPLSDGHMDVCLSPDASPETIEALRQVGEAAIARMKAEPSFYCPARERGQTHEWGYHYTNVGKPEYTKNCIHCGVKGELDPYGECLVCGHFLPLVIWSGEMRPPDGETLNPTVDHGVCAACRTLAEPNRGPCSWERGCACANKGMTL